MGTRTVFFHGLEHDDGEAPCHQDGLTTLAISQPHIRTNAKPGDIVIALMSHKLKRSTKFRFSGWKLHDIVYISEVQSALCWPDYAAKYPARRDCIYSFEDGLLTQKRNAYSHDWTNVLSDINTSGPCVLLLNAMQICEPGHSANGLLRGYGTTPEQEPHTTLVEQGFFMKQLNSDETIELDNSRRDLAPFAQKPATAQLHGSSDKQRRARMKWEVEPVVDWTVDDVCAWVRTVIRRDRASSGAICDAIKQIGVDGLVLQHLDAAALTEDPPRGLGVKRSMDRALLLAELQKLASRGQMPKGETEWAKQLRKNEGGALRRRWNSSSGARQIKPIRSGQELQNQRIEIEILREEVDRLRGAKHDHRPASLNVVNGCSGCKELAGLQRALRAAEESLAASIQAHDEQVKKLQSDLSALLALHSRWGWGNTVSPSSLPVQQQDVAGFAAEVAILRKEDAKQRALIRRLRKEALKATEEKTSLRKEISWLEAAYRAEQSRFQLASVDQGSTDDTVQKAYPSILL